MVYLDPYKKVEFPNFLTEEECLHVAHILRRDEHKILDIPNGIDDRWEDSGTTSKYAVYNLLRHPDIRPLNIPDRLFELPLFTPNKDEWFDELWIQCWGNILHQEESLANHSHSNEKDIEAGIIQPLVACSIYLDGQDPCYTHWDGIPQRNERGTLHVAGMHFEHEVKQNIHTTPRISIAFDIYWKADWIVQLETKRFLHAKRPTFISEDHMRRKRQEEPLMIDAEGHGIPRRHTILRDK